MSAVFYSHGKKYRLGLGPNANEHYAEGTSLREAFGRGEAGADGGGGGGAERAGAGETVGRAGVKVLGPEEGRWEQVCAEEIFLAAHPRAGQRGRECGEGWGPVSPTCSRASCDAGIL